MTHTSQAHAIATKLSQAPSLQSLKLHPRRYRSSNAASRPAGPPGLLPQASRSAAKTHPANALSPHAALPSAPLKGCLLSCRAPPGPRRPCDLTAGNQRRPGRASHTHSRCPAQLPCSFSGSRSPQQAATSNNAHARSDHSQTPQSKPQARSAAVLLLWLAHGVHLSQQRLTGARRGVNTLADAPIWVLSCRAPSLARARRAPRPAATSASPGTD